MTDKTLLAPYFSSVCPMMGIVLLPKDLLYTWKNPSPKKGQIAIKGPSAEKKQGSTGRTSAMYLSYWTLCTCKAKINDYDKIYLGSWLFQSVNS